MPDNRLTKAVRNIIQPLPAPKQEARGTVSGFALGVSPIWGQPYPEQQSGDAAGLISRQRMREVVLRTPTAAACLNAILDFTGGVKINVRNIDPSKPVPKQQQNVVKRIMNRPNTNQSWRQFILTLIRDIVTFGYGAVELVPTGNLLRPVDMWVMDGARLKIDFDEHGFTRGYDMLSARGVPIMRPTRSRPQGSESLWQFPQGSNMGATGQPSISSMTGWEEGGKYDAVGGGPLVHGWEPEEVMFFSLNPISESVYPHSRIVQLFTAALLEDLMIQFISERFTDSNIPFGVFDLGDVTETELKLAIDNWNLQGRTGNRIVMTGSKGAGSKWIPFGYHLKDLEATHLLQEFRMKIMGILGVTMNELGESQDINRSNGYNLSFTFKKRGVEPVLDEITQTLTRRLAWDVLQYDDMEFYAEEIDARDDFLMSQIDSNYQKLGILKPNEIRNRKGLTNILGGDEALIFTGNSWVPVDMLRDMAEELLAVERQSTGVSETGPEGTSAIRVRSSASNPSPTTGNELSPQASNGHNRGASSDMARQLGQK